MGSDKYFGYQMNDEKSKSTERQRKYFAYLCKLCIDNKLKFNEHPYDRASYMKSIGALVELLTKNNIDFKHNDDVLSTVDVSNTTEVSNPKPKTKPKRQKSEIQTTIEALGIHKGDKYYAIIRTYDNAKPTKKFEINECAVKLIAAKADGDFIVELDSGVRCNLSKDVMDIARLEVMPTSVLPNTCYKYVYASKTRAAKVLNKIYEKYGKVFKL